MRRILVLAALLLAIPAHAEVTIDWVTVGDPGNACDTQPQGCFGAVAYNYRISKFEVTNAQYAEFLNAVAAADPNALYNTSMGSGHGGITRSGSSGNYTYSAIAGRENMPVNFVSFYDSLRFSNWLDNGQGSGDTETGAYTITALGITNNSITRNAGANIFLTSEDEWYKAAYYDVASGDYFEYPVGTDVQTTCSAPVTTANTANCGSAVGTVTIVGAYWGSGSPFDTFDQGGNVFEWNEAVLNGSNRGIRGGDFISGASNLLAADRNDNGADPEVGFVEIGFRVASLLEPAPFVPSVPSLSPAGLLVLVASLLGTFGYYRRRL